MLLIYTLNIHELSLVGFIGITTWLSVGRLELGVAEKTDMISLS